MQLDEHFNTNTFTCCNASVRSRVKAAFELFQLFSGAAHILPALAKESGAVHLSFCHLISEDLTGQMQYTIIPKCEMWLHALCLAVI